MKINHTTVALLTLALAAVACGQSSDPETLAPATAEGIPAGSQTSAPDTTQPEAVTSTTDGMPEPSVTVPPTTFPPPPPIPSLERIEPIVVTLDFEGQAISEVSPGGVAGAGVIEALGDSDLYTFEAQKGEAFVLEQLGGCDFEGDDFVSAKIRGQGLTTNVAFLDGDCTSITRFEPDTSGTIEITVEKVANDATGTYAFRIVEVTDDPVIELDSGDVVFPDDPAGAGWIEGYGHQDVYRFEATEDRPFVIRQLGGCAFDGFDDFVSGRVRGDGINSSIIFQDGDCDSIDRFEPNTSGLVEIVVGNAANDVFGVYAFQIYELVTDDEEADAAAAELGASVTEDQTVITLTERVLFDFGSDALRREADTVLAELAELVRFDAVGPVLVIGHTDSVGDAEANQRLSEARATAVIDRLVALGVPADLLVPEGRGENDPVAPNVDADGNDNPDGRALNRRVEVVYGR